MHFFWDNRGRNDIIGSLSSDDFERRTSTGSEPFSILNCLDATKFELLRVFTLIETICAKIFVEASNVINDPKCNKGPKCNNFWP